MSRSLMDPMLISGLSKLVLFIVLAAAVFFTGYGLGILTVWDGEWKLDENKFAEEKEKE